jgi:hypothetical protein
MADTEKTRKQERHSRRNDCYFIRTLPSSEVAKRHAMSKRKTRLDSIAGRG